jgi:CubicO group peptidase (beta-lactamase class C family)
MDIALLGIILEDIYHKTFETLVKEKICSSNNMNHTSITVPDDQLNNLARGYNEEGVAVGNCDPGCFSAAVGLRSCTGDMLQYLHFNRNEKDSAVKLTHVITDINGKKTALTWPVKYTKQGNNLFWYHGGNIGFRSFCAFIMEKGISVVVLANSATDVDYIGIAILNYLQK